MSIFLSNLIIIWIVSVFIRNTNAEKDIFSYLFGFALIWWNIILFWLERSNIIQYENFVLYMYSISFLPILLFGTIYKISCFHNMFESVLHNISMRELVYFQCIRLLSIIFILKLIKADFPLYFVIFLGLPDILFCCINLFVLFIAREERLSVDQYKYIGIIGIIVFALSLISIRTYTLNYSDGIKMFHLALESNESLMVFYIGFICPILFISSWLIFKKAQLKEETILHSHHIMH